MTYQGNPSKKEIESMEKATEDAGIVAIHPDKLEEFAAHLVNKLKNGTTTWCWTSRCWWIHQTLWRGGKTFRHWHSVLHGRVLLMTERERLIIALYQIENVTALLENNEWKNYLYNYLSPIQYELERQLTNLSGSDRIKE